MELKYIFEKKTVESPDSFQQEWARDWKYRVPRYLLSGLLAIALVLVGIFGLPFLRSIPLFVSIPLFSGMTLFMVWGVLGISERSKISVHVVDERMDISYTNGIRSVTECSFEKERFELLRSDGILLNDETHITLPVLYSNNTSSDALMDREGLIYTRLGRFLERTLETQSPNHEIQTSLPNQNVQTQERAEEIVKSIVDA